MRDSPKEKAPRLRIRGKRSPSLVLKFVQAWQITTPSDSVQGARSLPGGEWEDSEGFHVGMALWDSSFIFHVAEQEEEAPEWQHASSEERAEVEQSTVLVCHVENQRLQEWVAESRFTYKDCLEVLRTCLGSVGTSHAGFDCDSGHVSWALEVNRQGDTEARDCGCPALARYLNGFVRFQGCEQDWNRVEVSWNCQPKAVEDLANQEGTTFWAVSLGDSRGGGLWVEDPEGKGPVIRSLEGVLSTGSVLEFRNRPVRVEAGRKVILEPWVWGDIWVVRTWKASSDGERPFNHRSSLAALGFGTKACGWDVESPDLPEECRGCSMTKFKADGVSLAPGAIEDGRMNPGIQGPVNRDRILWDVLFPYQLVDEDWVESIFPMSEAAAYRCKAASLDICRLVDPSDLPNHLNQLKAAFFQRDWYEGLLSSCQSPSEVPVRVKSLSQEVPLGEGDQVAPELFLQTRTVSLEEARREMSKWLEPATDEIVALETTTGAVYRTTAKEIDDLIQQGRKVLQLPGKCVLTRKSGVGKRRCRAVVCGNHLPSSEQTADRSDLYAGGIDALTIRIVLTYTSQFEHWNVCVLDVKTAFLYAPVRGSEEEGGGDAPLIVVKPPYFLIQLGLLKGSDRWVVRKALYGLQTSPRDWSVYRDKVLRSLRVEAPVAATLQQSRTDDCMWFLRSEDGALWGILIVYVDDLAAFGPTEVVQSLVADKTSVENLRALLAGR